MAAVAGIAALAVVLVQGVVSDTSEQISGSSARRTAAEVAAASVEAEAADATESVRRFVEGTNTDGSAGAWAAWERYYAQKCDRIGITYSDANISVAPTFLDPATGSTTFGTATYDDQAPSGTKAQALCSVS